MKLRDRLRDRLSALLAQGLSPKGLALSLVVGATLGVFPIIGATTLLCALAGAAFRLNHAALQLANYAMTAPQLACIVPFVRLGESLTGALPMPLNPLDLVPLFRADPARFLERFGLTGLRGILGWFVVAPILAAAMYVALLPPLRGLHRGLGLKVKAS